MASLIKRDPNKEGWENSEFPILCETCLGDNPYVRMTKCPFDKECKVCTRPFCVFRWRPGSQMRYKKTEICQTCSKLKNVCQTCLLDLDYGLPVQVRDNFMGSGTVDQIPVSDVNREYFAEQALRKLNEAESAVTGAGGKIVNPTLSKLARSKPYYARNLPHICTFFIKGECTRGAECPYRHETPEETELSHQNLKDRYYGKNDPVAAKILQQAEKMNQLTPPDDTNITTIRLYNLTPDITEKDITDHAYRYGEIKHIKMMTASRSALVTFRNRKEAEDAAEGLYGRLIIRGQPVSVQWHRPIVGGTGTQGGAKPASTPNFFSLPPAAPAMPGIPPPPGLGMPALPSPAPYYPSMDPMRMGTAKAPGAQPTANRPANAK
eukprot:CAMPEP_0177660728 /NCGR_PEP_ID=MMETSP0447-20121125/18221_1 /TAXON_ID=0 /ORGANISM="Stygamoeba regulata, Strain BSH-02190019" /LENGTH=378 /DNA_ID=CAMNT_0019165865 /DNA_START=28 /DNA_END=1164 /DNA_ORIENTATION=+